MITTIDHLGLTQAQASGASNAFTGIALDIENGLRGLAGQQIVLSISAVDPSGLKPTTAKLQLTLVGPCEIVSFEAHESKVTRLIANYPRYFTQGNWRTFTHGKRRTFDTSDGGNMTREQIVNQAVRHFRKAIRPMPPTPRKRKRN